MAPYKLSYYYYYYYYYYRDILKHRQTVLPETSTLAHLQYTVYLCL